MVGVVVVEEGLLGAAAVAAAVVPNGVGINK